jgi:hypothetical protein
MRIIRSSEYRVMPWKNGGGETTELCVSPTAGNFDWRVSIAKVNVDGAFSTFAGYERHIMVLSGAGMTLDMADRGKFDLEPLAPFTFSGDAQVNGSLLHGPVLDFNLMVRRDFGRGTLRVVDCSAGHGLGSGESLQLIHVLQGEGEIGNDKICPNDSFRLEVGELVSLSAPLKLVLCEIRPRWLPAPNA